MKKILFLLLLSVSLYGQVSTGQEQDFDYGLRNLSSQLITMPDTLVTKGTDGTYGHTSSYRLPISNAVFDALETKLDKTTTAVTSTFTLTNNGTTFTLSPLTGEIVDNSTVPPTRTVINFAGATNVTPLYPRTILYINSSGTLVQFNGATGDLTPLQKRQNLAVGVLATQGGVILAKRTVPSINYDASGRIETFFETMGVINREGNIISANGANLQINKSAGMTQRPMGNYETDRRVPDVTTDVAAIPIPAGVNLVGYRNGSGGWNYEQFTGSLTPNFWDNGTGTKATVDNNKFTTHRVYFFNGTDTYIIYLGQTQYGSLVDAELAVNNDSRIIDPATSPASLRSSIIIQKGVTNLTAGISAGTVKFINGPKFSGGASGGTSGAGVSNLQGIYNNSAQPQILTSSTLGDVEIRRGSASDADDVFKVSNGAGTTSFNISGNGLTGLTGTASGLLFNTNSSYTGGSTPILVKKNGLFTIYGSSSSNPSTHGGISFDGVNITGATDRIFTFPNVSGTIALTSNITGTINFIPKFTGTNSLGDSNYYGDSSFPAIYLPFFPTPFESKSTIKGNSNGGLGENSYKRSLMITDDLDNPVAQFDNDGRLDLKSYNGNGGVSVLYNMATAPTYWIGHYAFSGRASNGNLNTNAILGARLLSNNITAMDSEIRIEYMDGVNGSSSYAEPNKAVVINKAGFTIPSSLNFTNTKLSEPLAGGGFNQTRLQPISGNNQMIFQVAPSGTATTSVIEMYAESPLAGLNRGVIKNENGVVKIGGDAGNTPISFIQSNVQKLGVDASGTVNIANLSGTGTRIVTADASGNLSAITDNFVRLTGVSNQTINSDLVIDGTLQTTSTLTAANIVSEGVVRLKGYTVATLPAGTVGDMAYVTDATSPTYLGTLTGGGSVVCPVFYNGTIWVSH